MAEGHRLVQFNTVVVPGSVDEAAVRKRLLAEDNIEIEAGLGTLAGKVWRVGLMGPSSTPAHVILLLTALERILGAMSAKVTTGQAVAAAEAVLY